MTLRATIYAATPYLRTHPPARRQFRSPRSQKLSGVIVVHTAENTPDFVAFDGGAEAVARYEVNRTTPGSYADIVDSDSILNLVGYDDEAFHDGTGTNGHSLGLSIATRADVWPLAPAAWRAGAVEQAARAAARMAAHVLARRGILVPARRITAAQARARVPGFISHAELDPTRRSDPGASFPWDTFLNRYAELTGQTPGGDDMPITDDDLDRIEARLLTPRADRGSLRDLIVFRTGDLFNAENSKLGAILNAVNAVAAEVGADPIDEAALAAELAPALIAGLDIEGAVARALAATGATDIDEAALGAAVAADIIGRLTS